MAKFFARLDPHVQRVSGWLTVAGAALSAVYTVIAKAAPLFAGVNWAGAMLIGIALALATMLAMALIFLIIGVGFQYFRPRPNVEAEASKVGIKLPTETSKLRVEFDELKESFGKLGEIVKGIMESQTEMNHALGDEIKSLKDEGQKAATREGALADAFSKRFDKLERKIDLLEKLTSEFAAGQSDMSKLLNERVENLDKRTEAQIGAALATISEVHKLAIDETKELRERVGKIERLFDNQADRFDHRLENIDAAFSALANRDWHQRLFRELAVDFETLAKPVDEGKGIPDGPAWIRDAKSWRGKLDQWLVIADYYCVGIGNKVLAQPEHIYDSDHWKFDEKALTATQVHRFKELAIWWHNAEEAKPRVDRSFARALSSPSKHGRTESPPREGAEPE